ncbi:hypothetical protein [Spiroplasma endosymbiont of Villa modesta]|uniref:hypothetical protein n=1 Tax=Spiroplasma endosymbiont of Villa modesta TaxID=3066293 RepID=UPI00313BF7A3
MKCLLCEKRAVGSRKIMKLEAYSNDNFSFNLYFCKKHLEKELNMNGIKIKENK